ncbi:putative phosphatidate phosphatase [Pectinophora gossypiella]|uniref:putative phosphatidate phosphatase n=1 Tax=Pectinophora gossypiella TaxID=13191 RepID=UPI00214EBBD1|nr:putative phosphatidate phosphatase [Pectinophora gossypiella]
MAVDRLIWKIVLDFVILAGFGFALLAISLWAEPYHRGYFVSDQSIRLPYKEQTISEAVLALAGFALNVATIIAVEVVRDKRGKGGGEKFLSGSLIPGWLWESYRTIGIFTFGAACQQLTSNFAKPVIGRLRPHFYDVCRPVPTNTPEEFEYVTNYTCNGLSDLVKDARLSFPSAHSSFSMYSAIFFIFYLQTKCKWRGSKLLRHGVQYTVLLAAWYVGLSRVADHMHHWSDVAAGFAIGAVYAVLVFIFVLKPKKYGLPESWAENNQADLPRPVVAR